MPAGDEADVIDTRDRKRKWRVPVAAAAAALLAAGAATAIFLGTRRTDDADGKELIADNLAAPGRWVDSEGPQGKAGCAVQGKLTVHTTVRAAFKCKGSETVVKGDFRAEVNATLLTQGACAAIWFTWNPGRGGQVLLVCQDSISLGVDDANGIKIVDSLPATPRIQVRNAEHVGFQSADGVVAVDRSDHPVGRLAIDTDAPTTGKIRLGIYVQPQAIRQPFEVAFSGIDVRTA
jgi:hypothetical protein